MHLSVKDQFLRLIEELPEGATWDDVIESVHLHAVQADGLKDVSQSPVRLAHDLMHEFVVGPARES